MDQPKTERQRYGSAIPRPASEILPCSAAIVQAFRAADDLPDDHYLLSVAQRFGGHHQRQWAAEDSCRDERTDDHFVAAAKRAIDALNARRVALIEEIDNWVAGRFPSVATAPMHTETFGSVIDRLAIAWVRSDRFSEVADDRDLARAALQQLAALADAYDDLVRDVHAGRRRVPCWRALKRYGGSR